MPEKASLRSRVLAWVLWRLRLKRRFAATPDLRQRVLASRPKQLRPSLAIRRRYHVKTTLQDDRPVFTITPRGRTPKRHLLYLHGGAYVYEIAGPQWGLLDRLLRHLDASATVPLYPLAPEHTCPEVLAFTLAGYQALLSHPDGLPIVVLGDSAGGGLGLALAQTLRDRGLPLPAALVLLSPWLDVTCSDPRQPALESVDPLLAVDGLRVEGAWYAGALPPTDPRVSPLFGDLANLPPTLALTGTHDLLNPDVHRLQSRIRGLSTPFAVHEYPEMLHVWPAMPIPEAREALDDIARFLNKHLPS